MLTDEMKAAGWFEHDGKGQPLSNLTLVDVWLAGETSETHICEIQPAGCWNWDWESEFPTSCDIIAYKPETPHD